MAIKKTAVKKPAVKPVAAKKPAVKVPRASAKPAAKAPRASAKPPRGTKRTVIATELAPKAIGPYSQGIRANGFVFCAGQTPIDPETSKLIDGDIAAQTRRVLTNLGAVLDAAGTSLSKVVKTTVFLTDMANFKAMNEVYAEFFPANPPARSTFAVAGLPLGASVEIECIALE